MKAPCAFAVLLLMWAGSADPLEAADRQPPPACLKAVNAQLPGWQSPEPPEDLASFAKKNNLSINVAQADYDGDRTTDTAILLSAPGRRGDGRRQDVIAVCFNRRGGTRVQLIRDPYCSDGIAVAPKGTRAHDYTTEKTVTYWTNGVTGYCFEKASGTYLYRDGKFVLIIDSD